MTSRGRISSHGLPKNPSLSLGSKYILPDARTLHPSLQETRSSLIRPTKTPSCLTSLHLRASPLFLLSQERALSPAMCSSLSLCQVHHAEVCHYRLNCFLSLPAWKSSEEDSHILICLASPLADHGGTKTTHFKSMRMEKQRHTVFQGLFAADCLESVRFGYPPG